MTGFTGLISTFAKPPAEYKSRWSAWFLQSILQIIIQILISLTEAQHQNGLFQHPPNPNSRLGPQPRRRS